MFCRPFEPADKEAVAYVCTRLMRAEAAFLESRKEWEKVDKVAEVLIEAQYSQCETLQDLAKFFNIDDTRLCDAMHKLVSEAQVMK